MTKALEREVDILLLKLQKILREINPTDQDVESRDKKSSKEDDFNSLKTEILQKIMETCQLLEKSSGNVGGGFLSSTTDPKAAIKRNRDIRTNMRIIEKDFARIESIYDTEKKKRRSKMSPEEMNDRAELIDGLKQEIGELKEILQPAPSDDGISSGINTYSRSPTAVNTVSSTRNSVSRPAALTNDQRVRVQAIKQRNKEMEETYLTKIDEHIDRLNIAAININEELRQQGRMMDDLGQRIEETQENVSNMNVRMKETLKKVRSADKFFVDIMCVLLLLGLAGVLYAVVKTN